MSNSNFWKISFHPKIMFLALLKVKQLPNITDWHIEKTIIIIIVMTSQLKGIDGISPASYK